MLRRLVPLLAGSVAWMLAGLTISADDADEVSDAAPCPTSQAETDPLPSLEDEDAEQGMVLRSDRAEAAEDGTTLLAGSVSVRSGSLLVTTPRAKYDPLTRTVSLDAGMTARTPLVKLSGQRGTVNLGEASFVVDAVEFSGLGDGFQGTADRVVGSADGIDIESVQMSSCPVGEESWRFNAAHLTASEEDNTVALRRATLLVGKVPVLYLPWFSFPLSRDPKENRWVPYVGTHPVLGTDIMLPVQLRPGESYDLTIAPRVRSEWGAGIEGEVRMRARGEPLTVRYDWMKALWADPGSEAADYYRGPPDDPLWALSVSHEAHSSSWWSWVRFEDSNYAWGNSEATWTPSVIGLHWTRGELDVGLRVQAPVLNVDGMLSYATVPAIEFSTLKRLWLVDTRVEGSFTRFKATDGGLPVAVSSGQRSHLDTTLEKHVQLGPIEVYGGSTGHATFYSVSRDVREETMGQRRLAYSLFAGGKIRAWRDIDLGNDRFRQTLEMRGQVVSRNFATGIDWVVPQLELAQFDNGRRTFHYETLFDIWQVNGRDRLPERRDVALGVVSRVFGGSSDRELFSGALGMLHRVHTNSVQVDSGIEAIAWPATMIVAALKVAPTDRFRAELGGTAYRGMPKPNSLHFSALRQGERGSVLHLGVVRHRREGIEEISAGAALPLNRKWAAFASGRMDRLRKRNLDAFAGIQYKSCCLTFRLMGRERMRPDLSRADSSSVHERTVLLQINLERFLAWDSGLEEALSRGMPGFAGLERNEWIGSRTIAW